MLSPYSLLLQDFAFSVCYARIVFSALLLLWSEFGADADGDNCLFDRDCCAR